jgi:hypothetical protein
MLDLKHVGKIKASGRKCLVAFRTLPGDAYSCLVIPTENLRDDQHDSLIQLVESASGQSAHEFADALSRAKFPDGSTMLPALHTQGKLIKIPTDQIEMTPNFNSSIVLSELNSIIAEQQGIAVDDLSVRNDTTSPNKNVEVVDVAQIDDMMKKPQSKDNVGRTTSASITEEEQPLVEPTGTPDEVAKFYRSQADKLAKQAAEFRRKAEDIVPTKKKSG